MNVSLHRLPGTFSIHRLAPDSDLPEGLLDQPFYALLKSADELSVCCPTAFAVASEQREDGWICLAVDGPLDFSLTGIVAGLTAALAAADVPVFVISSFDTDYLLLKSEHFDRAADALRRSGTPLRNT